MPKLQYDPQSKILSIRLREDIKSIDSDIKGKAVLDFGPNGELVNIDIMEMNLEDVITSGQMEKFPDKITV